MEPEPTAADARVAKSNAAVERLERRNATFAWVRLISFVTFLVVALVGGGWGMRLLIDKQDRQDQRIERLLQQGDQTLRIIRSATDAQAQTAAQQATAHAIGCIDDYFAFVLKATPYPPDCPSPAP